MEAAENPEQSRRIIKTLNMKNIISYLLPAFLLLSFSAFAQTNVALNKPTKQSSTDFDGNSERAADGNTDGKYSAHSVCHTSKDDNPWWEVDLGAIYDISEIIIWNRTDTDDDVWNRTNDIYVMVSETKITANSTSENLFTPDAQSFTSADQHSISLSGNKRGRYVRVFLNRAGYLHLAEVEVYGTQTQAQQVKSKETSSWYFSGPEEIKLTITKRSGDPEIYDCEFSGTGDIDESFKSSTIEKQSDGKYYLMPSNIEITFTNSITLHLGEEKLERELPLDVKNLIGTKWNMVDQGGDIISFSENSFIVNQDGGSHEGPYSLDPKTNTITIDGESHQILRFTSLTIEAENVGFLEKILDKIQARLDAGESPLEIVRSGVAVEKLYGKKYADGLIFFVDVDDKVPEIEGMVAATKDQSEGAEWGCKGTDIKDLNNVPYKTGVPEGTGAEIGDGAANTRAILKACNTDGIAAKLCRDLGPEWFLPSIEELNLIQVNLEQNGHTNFEVDATYWSSTESDNGSAWDIELYHGLQYYYHKDGKIHVRAARAF